VASLFINILKLSLDIINKHNIWTEKFTRFDFFPSAKYDEKQPFMDARRTAAEDTRNPQGRICHAEVLC